MLLFLLSEALREDVGDLLESLLGLGGGSVSIILGMGLAPPPTLARRLVRGSATKLSHAARRPRRAQGDRVLFDGDRNSAAAGRDSGPHRYAWSTYFITEGSAQAALKLARGRASRIAAGP
jgi:hypothetical protein